MVMFAKKLMAEGLKMALYLFSSTVRECLYAKMSFCMSFCFIYRVILNYCFRYFNIIHVGFSRKRGD